MLDSESFSIFVPELEELMNEAPSADMVMDDPGIIPINIGSPAPFVELPDDNADAPKVEEVPVEPVSFTVPVSSEGSLAIFRQTIQKAQQVRSLMLPELMQSRR